MGLDKEFANEVAKIAVSDRTKLKHKISLLKTLIICMCVFLCVACICGSVVGIYAVNRNFEYLESLVIETETVVEEVYEVEADSQGDGNAIAVDGNNNTIAGGDINGESKNKKNQNND